MPPMIQHLFSLNPDPPHIPLVDRNRRRPYEGVAHLMDRLRNYNIPAPPVSLTPQQIRAERKRRRVEQQRRHIAKQLQACLFLFHR